MSDEVLVFDVNETLLDLSGLRNVFARVFGTSDPIGEWFARLLHGSLVANHLHRYRPFGEIGKEQLVALARRRGVDLDPSQAEDILSEMASLPPHPDVVPGLERLARAGFRLATLTNNPRRTLEAQLRNARLDRFFEKALTVEEVARFKPAPEPYRKAAEILGVDIARMTMVAAHDWDVAGAVAAGARGIFVARSLWALPDPPPQPVVADLAELADTLGA